MVCKSLILIMFDLNYFDETILFPACQSGNIELVKFLVSKFVLDHQSYNTFDLQAKNILYGFIYIIYIYYLIAF